MGLITTAAPLPADWQFGLLDLNTTFLEDADIDSALKLVEVIERGKIVMSMVGLLFAVPNPRLTRRLKEERGLLQDAGRLSAAAEATEADQAPGGLNFVTRRPGAEVREDFLHVLKPAYSRRHYFERCLEASKARQAKAVGDSMDNEAPRA